MPTKTYPQLDPQADVEDADLLASYRSLGPLKKVTALVVKDYCQTDVPGTNTTFVQAGTGAVTRTIQAKAREVFSALDFIPVALHASIADHSITTDLATYLTAAVTQAVAVGGGIVELAPGTFPWSILTVPSNVTLRGSGPGTTVLSLNTTNDVTDDTANGLINTKNAENVLLSDFVIDTNDEFPTIKIILSTNVRTKNVYMDGLLTSGNLVGYGIIVSGSDQVYVDTCRLKNLYNGVYICKSSFDTGTTSGTIYVDGCKIWQDDHGTTRQYPTGIYAFHGTKLVVSNSDFDNIKPSLAGSGYSGYGIYEGDGTWDTVIVDNCRFTDDDGDVTDETMGISTTETTNVFITNVRTKGPFSNAVRARALHVVINGYLNEGGSTTGLMVGGGTGTTPKEWIVNNATCLDCLETGILAGDSNSVAAETVSINNPVVKRAGRAGIWSRYSSFTLISNPTIIDCNTTDQSTNDANCGISFFGSTAGNVVGGIIKNVSGGTGHMKYGVVCSTATNTLVVQPSLVISGMETGTTLNLLSAAPTTGTWAAGQIIPFWNGTPGGLLGVRCLTAGTPGTWEELARSGDAMSFAAASSIAAIGNAVNTTGKFTGKTVFDTTNARIMVAQGSTAAGAWKGDGVTVTPS